MKKPLFISRILMTLLLSGAFFLIVPTPAQANTLCICKYTLGCEAIGSRSTGTGASTADSCENTCLARHNSEDEGFHKPPAKFFQNDESGLAIIAKKECDDIIAQVQKGLDTDKSAVGSAAAVAKSTPRPFVTPNLSVNIPGLEFTDPTGEDKVVVNFIGEYVNAIYKWLMGIGITLSIVMMMIGGLQYAVGSATGELTAAKNRIKNAATGFILLMSVFLVLYTVNPQMTIFRALELQTIKQINLKELLAKFPTGANGLITGGAITDPNFHYSKPADNFGITDEQVREIATRTGVPFCIINTVIKKESGGKGLIIGHDENFPRAVNKKGKPFKVPSRRNFLISGVKYSGATFTPLANSKDSYDYATMNNSPIRNDDNVRIISSRNKPPDYGIDWRFSHGIGLGQFTIFPGKSYSKKIEGPNGPEWARKLNDTWYTVTDLLNPDKSIEATVNLMSIYFSKTNGDPEKFFTRYAGGSAGNKRAMKHYCGCLKEEGLDIPASC